MCIINLRAFILETTGKFSKENRKEEKQKEKSVYSKKTEYTGYQYS